MSIVQVENWAVRRQVSFPVVSNSWSQTWLTPKLHTFPLSFSGRAFKISRNTDFDLWHMKETNSCPSGNQCSSPLLFKSYWSRVLSNWVFSKGFQPGSQFCLFYLSEVGGSWIFAFLNRTILTIHLVLNSFQGNSEIRLGHPEFPNQCSERTWFSPPTPSYSTLVWRELVHF